MRLAFLNIFARSILLAILWAIAPHVAAHEVRPAFLSVTETEPAKFSVLWKQPVIDGRRLKITPIFPPDCISSEPRLTRTANNVAERWTVSCSLTDGQISLEGLERSLTDVFAEIRYLSIPPISALIKPEKPRLDLSGSKASPAKQYLWIGVEHIIYGWDHLLFVIGLTLLVARRQILGVASAFTIAHSITLALAALGGLTLPSRPVEILIAASIVLLAIEVLHKAQGRPSLGARKPYLISFLIGLIHGCGFAGALSEIGLPKGTELLALLLFNLGVELGQFAIIALIIALLFFIGKASLKYLRAAEITASYAIAAIAMYWVIERVAGYIV